MYNIREVELSYLLEECAYLFDYHAMEVEGPHIPDQLKIDIERYREIDEDGDLSCMIAECDGRAVGYSAFVSYPLYHFKHLRVADSDCIYILPKYRSGTGLGLKLLRSHEKLLKEKGIDVILWRAKPETQMFYILEALGYTEYERTYKKMLR